MVYRTFYINHYSLLLKSSLQETVYYKLQLHLLKHFYIYFFIYFISLYILFYIFVVFVVLVVYIGNIRVSATYKGNYKLYYILGKWELFYLLLRTFHKFTTTLYSLKAPLIAILCKFVGRVHAFPIWKAINN